VNGRQGIALLLDPRSLQRQFRTEDIVRRGVWYRVAEIRIIRMRGSQVDRLSALPDEIISHILSFVQHKSVIRNSLLVSKRLKNSWNTVSALNFNSYFIQPLSSFHNYVLTTLNRRRNDLTVHTVRFVYDRSVDDHVIERVFEYVTSNRIKYLTLGSSSNSALPFPNQLLHCDTLTILTLKCCEFDRPIVLPNLTSLRLECCWFSHHNHNDCFDLSAYFPNLNHLRMFCCYPVRGKIFKVSGANLVYMEMCYGLLNCKIEISAPKLTFFSYKHCELVDFSVISLPSLERAELHVPVRFLNLEKEILRLQELFQAFRCEPSVRLSYTTILELKKALAGEKLSLYPQLRKAVEAARDGSEDGWYELNASGVESLTEKLLKMKECLENRTKKRKSYC